MAICYFLADFSPMTTFPSSLDVIQTIPEDFISEKYVVFFYKLHALLQAFRLRSPNIYPFLWEN